MGLFLTTALAWGGNYVFVLVGLQYTDPLSLAFLRAGIGLVGVFVFVRVIGHERALSARDRRDALLLGVPSTALFLALWFVAASKVPAGEAAVLIYTFPLWVALLSPWVLGHALGSRHFVAVAIGFGGIILLSQPWAVGGAAPPFSALAELLGAAVSWAVGTVVFQRRFTGVEALREANLYQLAGGTAALFVVTLAFGPLEVPAGPAPFWWAVIWLGVFGTAYAYAAWYFLLAHVRAVTLATYTFLVPLVALALGVTFLGERFNGFEIAGIAAVVLAIYLIGTAHDRTPRAGAPGAPYEEGATLLAGIPGE